MTYYTDVVLDAVRKHAEPVISSVIAAELDDLESDDVYKALSHLANRGLIERVGRRDVPPELRRRGSPKQAWAYKIPDDETAEPAVVADAVDTELARLLADRVESSEDPADPEAALDELPGDATACIRIGPTRDPICRAIERLPRLQGAADDARRLYQLADWLAPKNDSTTTEANARRDVAAYLCGLAAKLESAA